MGFAGRKPMLPAPTDSLVDESVVEEREEQEVSEDLATDLSQQTDRTHHTIPEDGSPITISTRKRSSKLDKFTKASNASQTSLLIEYFNGGTDSDPNHRPSVRVKVTPSSRKSKESGEGHILLTQAHNGNKKQSTTRRISLGSKSPQVAVVGSDISLLNSTGGLVKKSTAPFDIEINHHSDRSDMSASPEARYIAATSDISSMPAESMLGAPQSTLFAPVPRPAHGSTVSSLPGEESVISAGSDVQETTRLKPPIIPRGFNSSNERITQKVIEKLSNKPREQPVKINYKESDKNSNRSTSRDVVGTSYDQPRMTAKHFKDDESATSPTERSLLTGSVISAGGKSLSDRSARSVATNNSINNPKLLQTVEDVVKRLILPELKELKELKKDQRHHTSRSKHEKDYNDLSETSILREKSARRSISGSKSKRRSSKESIERSGSRRRKSSHREYDYDSLSDSDSRRDASMSSASVEDTALLKKHKDHHTRDLAAAGLLGAGLTAAALELRESEESLQRRRRRKRSKSRSSRSASIAESEEIFQKHKVPPMPMASEINSELTQGTRSSLLSSHTSTSHLQVNRDLQEVVRGSPGHVESYTPPRHSGEVKHPLGMHHANLSEHNLSSGRLAYEQRDDDTLSPETERYGSFSAEDLLEDPDRWRRYEQNLHTQHPIRRGLSPIQSVASYATTEPNRNSFMHQRSSDTLASMRKRNQQLKEEVSLSSFVSAPSPDSRKNRPQGVSHETRSEVMGQLPVTSHHTTTLSRGIEDRFADDEHEYENHRDSFATDQSFENKRFSGISDNTSDLMYVDKVTAGHHVVPVSGANPEFVAQPYGVESAVASVVEPSLLSQSPQHSRQGSFAKEDASNHSLSREVRGGRQGSPLKDELTMRNFPIYGEPKQFDLSPPQSPALSYGENTHEYVQHLNKNLPVIQGNTDMQASPQSEITTNPSVIHGPIGGLNAGHPDPWIADTPGLPIASQEGISRNFSSGAIDLIPEGLNVSQRHTYDSKPNTYVIGQSIPTPPGVKDEGYATGDNYPSPGPIVKAHPILDDYNVEDEYDGKLDDPFVTKQNQYMSGFSQGMSPLYDSATGRGRDRIQSKDIVALMDHLTVRDAQRNARDQEILVTLVRSAADMRNSFEDMKAFIAEQDEMIMTTADKQHEHTQKVVGGPRPLPANTRSARTTPMQEDIPTKRRNVFKRALEGLGSKNTAELQNIEVMLMKLLNEVEALRAQQGVGSNGSAQHRSNSNASEDRGQPPTETGYEPEGRAGTASTGRDLSGFFSNNSSRQGQYAPARKYAENRVSTVMEGDEEYEDIAVGNQYLHQQPDNQHTPHATSPDQEDDYYRDTRGQSVPLSTPPRIGDQPRALSTENMPQMSYDSGSGRKDNRRTFSSVIPKFVSRWSKTTTDTSDPRTPNFRGPTERMSGSGGKQRPYSQVSRSGSALDQYAYDYDQSHNPDDDRLRSATSLQNDEYYASRDQENRPPSPLVPSAISDNPKYQSHRDSQNLMHPQPRQGPTGRYQFHLENAAYDYRNEATGAEAISPASVHSVPVAGWNNQQSAYNTQQGYNNSTGQREQVMSPMSDISSVNSTSRRHAASRAPRSTISEDANEPLVPQRANKASGGGYMSPSTYVDDVRAARAGSPGYDKSPMAAIRSGSGNVSARKPSGPRPLSSGSNKAADAATKRTRFNDGSF